MTTTTENTRYHPSVPLDQLDDSQHDSRAQPSAPDERLLESVTENGVLVPLHAFRDGADSKFVIIDGRRRFRAAVKARRAGVPVIEDLSWKEGDTKRAAEIRLLAWELNANRKGMTAYDTAMNIRKAVADGLSQSQVAKKMHQSDGLVSQYLEIFKLDPRVQVLIQNNAGEGVIAKVRVLARFKNPEQQYMAAQKAFGPNPEYTVTDLENVRLMIEAREQQRAAKEGKRGKITVTPSMFRTAKFVAKTDSLRGLAQLFELGLRKQRASDKPDPARVAYCQGQVDVCRMMFGMKKMPKIPVIRDLPEASKKPADGKKKPAKKA
jgi:ParB/RepB/Spo0J family partition protein